MDCPPLSLLAIPGCCTSHPPRVQIRDAQEDLLYMLAAEQVIGRDAVLDIVRTVIVNDFAFNDDYQLLLAARQRLLAATAVVTAQR